MAIVVESTTSLNWTLRTTLTLTKPTGTVDGDLLIAVVGDEDTDSTPPAGWTLVREQSVFGPIELSIYSKVASSEPASWDWTISNNNCAGGVLRISGYGPTSPIYTSADGVASDTATPSFNNTITPSIANSLIIFATVSRQASNNHTGHAIVTSNPTWTSAFNVISGDDALSAVYAIRPETTATGNSSLSFLSGSSAADSVGMLLAIKPLVNISVDVDNTGVLNISGNNVDIITDQNITLDNAGILTLGGNLVDITNQQNTVWTEEVKNSSVWTEENK